MLEAQGETEPFTGNKPYKPTTTMKNIACAHSTGNIGSRVVQVLTGGHSTYAAGA